MHNLIAALTLETFSVAKPPDTGNHQKAWIVQSESNPTETPRIGTYASPGPLNQESNTYWVETPMVWLLSRRNGYYRRRKTQSRRSALQQIPLSPPSSSGTRTLTTLVASMPSWKLPRTTSPSTLVILRSPAYGTTQRDSSPSGRRHLATTFPTQLRCRTKS